MVKLLFPYVPVRTAFFGRKSLCTAHHEGWGVTLPSLREEYLNKLFRTFLHGRFISSFPFTDSYITADLWVDEISVLHCEATDPKVLRSFHPMLPCLLQADEPLQGPSVSGFC